jgi:NAD(P)H-dependent flavin oxidoreductase YrpB (nitropropane dioxygenase family)
VKQALVAASELDTRLVMRPLRNTERVLKNAAVDRLLEKEKALGAKIKFEDNPARGRGRPSAHHERGGAHHRQAAQRLHAGFGVGGAVAAAEVAGCAKTCCTRPLFTGQAPCR